MLRYQFTHNGHRYSVTGKTQKELMERVAKRKKRLEEADRITREMSVQAWKVEWLATYKAPNVTRETLESYRGILSHLTLIMPMKDVKPAHLQGELNVLRGRSASLIHKFRVLLNQMFEDAADNGLCQTNPARKLQEPKGTVTPRRALTPYERKITLLAAENSKDGNYIMLMLLCGLRPSEAGRVVGFDLDRKTHRLHVRGTKTAAADRFVPVPEPLFSRLASLRADEHAVTDTNGSPTTKYSRRRMWARFASKMAEVAAEHPEQVGGIGRDLTAYCLRHTYATDLERAGVPLNVARDLLGHASVLITSRVYTHRTEDALRDAQEKIEKLNGMREPERDVKVK